MSKETETLKDKPSFEEEVKYITQEFVSDISINLSACIPLMVSRTADTFQFESDMKVAARLRGYDLVYWDSNRGLYYRDHRHQCVRLEVEDERKKPGNLGNILFNIAMQDIASLITKDERLNSPQGYDFSKKTIFLVRDPAEWLFGSPITQNKPHATRSHLINLVNDCTNTQCHIVFYGTGVVLHEDSKRVFHWVEHPLPGIAELEPVYDLIAQSAMNAQKNMNEKVTKPKAVNRRNALLSAQGLSAFQAEQAFSLGVAKCGRRLNDAKFPHIVADKRRDFISGEGFVDIISPQRQQRSCFAGYEYVKERISRDIEAMGPDASEFGVAKQNGILLGGPAGVGKSELAKWTALRMNRDLVQLSPHRIMDSKWGESEKRLAQVLHMTRVYGDGGCVLWIDEADKLFGSLTSKSEDSTSGTAQRMLNVLLTYLSERQYDPRDNAYILGTFNDGWQIPDAIMRPGRFDTRLWLELPNESERSEIFKVHLNNRKQDPETMPVHDYSKLTENFTGAEIAFAVNDGVKRAFVDNRKVHDCVLEVIDEIEPNYNKPDAECHNQMKWAVNSSFTSSHGPKQKPAEKTQSKGRNFEEEPDLASH